MHAFLLFAYVGQALIIYRDFKADSRNSKQCQDCTHPTAVTPSDIAFCLGRVSRSCQYSLTASLIGEHAATRDECTAGFYGWSLDEILAPFPSSRLTAMTGNVILTLREQSGPCQMALYNTDDHTKHCRAMAEGTPLTVLTFEDTKAVASLTGINATFLDLFWRNGVGCAAGIETIIYSDPTTATLTLYGLRSPNYRTPPPSDHDGSLAANGATPFNLSIIFVLLGSLYAISGS